jgi:hypothetical protein
MKKIILACLFGLAVLTIGVCAQEELPSPGITPDSFLYGLDRALEALQKALTFMPEAKAKLALQLASERLAEAKEMERKGKTELANKAAEDYGKELDEGRKYGEEIAEAAKKREVEEIISKATSVHIKVLEKILPDDPLYLAKRKAEDVNVEVAPTIEEKAKRRLNCVGRRLEEVKMLVEMKKTELAEEVAEDYEEELNESIDTIKRAEALGRNITALAEHVSEMTYKHIEVLQEVLEKVPEQAKPHIEHAMDVSMKGHETAVERILERVNRTMEEVGNFTCGADSDCRGLICPTVIGYDTPVCFRGKCKCGAKWDLNETEWRERFGESLTSETEETLKKVKQSYSKASIEEKVKHVPAGVARH